MFIGRSAPFLTTLVWSGQVAYLHETYLLWNLEPDMDDDFSLTQSWCLSQDPRLESIPLS